jgi:glycosyltransferase involved in cell wall biosynthesis
MNFSFVLYNLATGGSERQAIILARGLRQIGHSVQFVGFIDGPLRQKIQEENFTVKVINWNQKTGNGFFGLFYSFWVNFVGVISFLRYLRSQRIDVLMPYTLIPNIRCGVLHKFGKVRLCIWNQRDAGFSDGGSLFWKLAAKMVQTFISNSTQGADYLIRFFAIPPSRIHIVYNGIEQFEQIKVNRLTLRKSFGLEDSCFAVCMIANISFKKNHELLINAWAEFLKNRKRPNSVRLLLAGRQDDAYNSVVNQVQNMGLSNSVTLLGSLDDVHPLVFACDCGAFSALSEGCPNGVLECMAAGLAVAATDIPAIRDIVAPANYSYLSPDNDCCAMAQSLLQLEENKAVRDLVGGANKAIINDRFGISNLVEKTMAIIEKYIN